LIGESNLTSQQKKFQQLLSTQGSQPRINTDGTRTI
jgi:hypothetical protein